MSNLKKTSNPQATTRLIIVMGVSGSGKSTLAKSLSDSYGYEFLDADDFHTAESRALMARGIGLTEVQRGPWVEAIKLRLLENASQHKHTTLAFSGLKQKHRDILRSAGLNTIVLYLVGDKSTIEGRIYNRKNHFMAPQLLDSQFASMENPLDEADVHQVDVLPSVDQVIAQAHQVIDLAFSVH